MRIGGFEHTESTNSKDQVPECFRLDGLEGMRDHRQSKEDAIDNASSQRRHISVCCPLSWVVWHAASRPNSHGGSVVSSVDNVFFCRKPVDPGNDRACARSGVTQMNPLAVAVMGMRMQEMSSEREPTFTTVGTLLLFYDLGLVTINCTFPRS